MMMRLPLGSMSLCFVLSGIAVQAHTQAPTWENGVANIIQAKCAPCHKPGEAAPFALTSYEQVSRRGSFIKQVIENGYMPPWKPDKHYVQYDNDRSLTAAEKKILLNWIENKMPRGNAAPTPPAPVLIPKLNTNYHRLPDTTITMQTPFVVPGDSYERFVIVKIPIELPDSANVEAIEFVSNNKKLIHHVNYSIHPVAEDIPLNLGPNLLNLAEEDPALSEQWKPFKKTISYYGGWIPGASFEAYPKGMGWVMPKRGVMLLTLHFAPSAVTDSCIAGINLFYTSQPVLRKVKVISFGSGGIGEAQISPPLRLLPNQVRTFTLGLSNPAEDFSVMYVWPHMHLLGKKFKAYAVSPKGDTIRLAYIPDWDFRWQEIYRFKKLVPIPRGSKLFIEGTYDNTANNPFNPYNPPRMIYSTANMETTNEMLTLMMVYLPYEKGDENLSIALPRPGKTSN